jgi:hypothetical protein
LRGRLLRRKWSTGGAGKWAYTVGTQGHYAGCTVVTGCIVHDYPWLQLKVLGNGAWTKPPVPAR